MKHLTFALALLVIPSISRGQQTERVLIPFFAASTVHGAGGSQFLTSLVGCVVDADRAQFALSPADPPVSLLRGCQFVKPLNDSANGRLLTLDNIDSPHVSWRLVLSSAAADAGVARVTLIPIARERDWRSGTTVFPIVGGLFPGDSDRAMLRVYLLDEPPPGFNVSLELLTSAPLDVTPSPFARDFQRDGNDSSYPWHTAVTLTNLFAVTPCRIFGYACLGITSIRLVPSNPNVRYWALLSMTDNKTQEVLVDSLN